MGPKHARAEASLASPVRGITTLLFLAGLTAAFLFSQQYAARSRHPGVYAHVAASLKSVVEQALPKPDQSSEFDRELVMGPAELMRRWEPLIAQAAEEFHIPKDWIRAVMRMESGGRTMLGKSQPITSHAGAMGLMQVMPGTYAEMRDQLGLGSDPYDPHDNVFAGAAYLRFLYRRFGNPAMFAAYNYGPGGLVNHLAHGTPLPAETSSYVKGIAGMLGRARGADGVATLTRPDGTPIRISRASVRSVRAALAGEYADSVRSVIVMGKKRQGVRESVAVASEAIGVL